MNPELITAIREQLCTNVRDGLNSEAPLDIPVGDEWQTFPYTYENGVFTVDTPDGPLRFCVTLEVY